MVWNDLPDEVCSCCFREITDLGSQLDGSVAEWSKALVLGTSLFGGVGLNPTTAISRKT